MQIDDIRFMSRMQPDDTELPMDHGSLVPWRMPRTKIQVAAPAASARPALRHGGETIKSGFQHYRDISQNGPKCGLLRIDGNIAENFISDDRMIDLDQIGSASIIIYINFYAICKCRI